MEWNLPGEVSLLQDTLALGDEVAHQDAGTGHSAAAPWQQEREGTSPSRGCVAGCAPPLRAILPCARAERRLRALDSRLW